MLIVVPQFVAAEPRSAAVAAAAAIAVVVEVEVAAAAAAAGIVAVPKLALATVVAAELVEPAVLG